MKNKKKYYRVVNKTTGKSELLDEFSSKEKAEQAIVNTIRGCLTKEEALKYYKTLTTKEIE